MSVYCLRYTLQKSSGKDCSQVIADRIIFRVYLKYQIFSTAFHCSHPLLLCVLMSVCMCIATCRSRSEREVPEHFWWQTLQKQTLQKVRAQCFVPRRFRRNLEYTTLHTRLYDKITCQLLFINAPTYVSHRYLTTTEHIARLPWILLSPT